MVGPGLPHLPHLDPRECGYVKLENGFIVVVTVILSSLIITTYNIYWLDCKVYLHICDVATCCNDLVVKGNCSQCTYTMRESTSFIPGGVSINQELCGFKVPEAIMSTCHQVHLRHIKKMVIQDNDTHIFNITIGYFVNSKLHTNLFSVLT